MPETDKIKEAIDANIAVHTAMADDYNHVEPHFRPESLSRVRNIIQNLSEQHPLTNALDLGCGTGFMINILKDYSQHITGVDVTPAMMEKVDLSGSAKIELIEADTGEVELSAGHYDIATAYTFLDHLYDMMPTFRNCYKALKPGGVFYADLSPNAYFWDRIKGLDFSKEYDPIVTREILAVTKKNEEIEEQFHVDKDLFTLAEYQKHVIGGLKEEMVRDQLVDIGFSEVEFIYHWFIGQAQLINDESVEKEVRFNHATTMHNYLTKSLPLSRNLFKYIGFIAKK